MISLYHKHSPLNYISEPKKDNYTKINQLKIKKKKKWAMRLFNNISFIYRVGSTQKEYSSHKSQIDSSAKFSRNHIQFVEYINQSKKL